MKILALVRHAKAEQTRPEQTDFDCNLTSRDNGMLLKWLPPLKKRFYTQLLITSPAKRALKTASLFADEFTIEKKKSWKGLFCTAASAFLKSGTSSQRK